MDNLFFTICELKSFPNQFFPFADPFSDVIHNNYDIPDFELDVIMTDDKPISKLIINLSNTNLVIWLSQQQVAEYLAALKFEIKKELKTQFNIK